MILKSMIRFVKEQGNIGMEVQSIGHQLSDRVRRFELIQNYADLLLKEIVIGMAVPCDEFGNVLEEPLQEHYTDCNEEQNAKDWLYNLEKYNQAKDRVLFKGFKIVDFPRNTMVTCRHSKSITDETGLIHLFWYDTITQTWELSNGLKNIETLTVFNSIELTETALKEIGYGI